MGKYLHLIFIAICMSVFVSCEEDKTGGDIYLIGDSIIKAWDLDESFSDYKVHNLGINGAGLETIKNYSNEDNTAWVVCMIGTNDLQYGMTAVQRENYADDYLSTISKLGGKQIVLFSVLPSSVNNRHEQIPYFNELIRVKVKDYSIIKYVDVYDYFLADDSISIKKEYTKDGLHLNQTGYNYLNSKLKEIIPGL